MTNASSLSNPRPHGLNAFKIWLDHLGWGEAPIEFLAGDASFRKYYRLTQNGESRLLMVAPPAYENPQDYIHVSELLQTLGLSAPHVYEADLDQGLVLLEDFGDKVYSHCLKKGHSELDLYDKALDVLIHLHKQEISPGHIPPYDLDKFLEEVLVFLEWAYPKLTGQTVSQAVERQYIQLWTKAFDNLPRLPQSLVLRDFMVDNLMWLPERQGVKSCGLLDFQDALWGDPTYDLVSLLEDARRDVSPSVVETLLNKYFQALPKLNSDAFYKSYFTWGAQRSTKIIGVFTRLAVRDKKNQYLQHIPRIWRILEQDFKHPALHNIMGWFDEHVPLRETPRCT